MNACINNILIEGLLFSLCRGYKEIVLLSLDTIYKLPSTECVSMFQKFHHELVGKEGLVEDIRKKAQHLLRTKQGVQGLDSLQQQLTDLGDYM